MDKLYHILYDIAETAEKKKSIFEKGT